MLILNKTETNIMNYAREVFGDQRIVFIIYGSSLENSNSDLDLCFFVDHMSYKQFSLIKEFIVHLHTVYNLPIDEEVPYEKKLIYTFNEIEHSLNQNIFEQCNKIRINDIPPYSEYLKSDEMRTRLLYNILTTRHLINSNLITEHSINMLKYRAWCLIITTIFRYYNNVSLDIDSLINCLITDKKRNRDREDFLGYKPNSIDKEFLTICLSEMHLEKKLMKEPNGNYRLLAPYP